MIFGFFKKKPEVVTDRLDIKVDTISDSKEKKIYESTDWLSEIGDADKFDLQYYNDQFVSKITLSSKPDAFKFGENGYANIQFALEISFHEDSRDRKTVDEIAFILSCEIGDSDEDSGDVFSFEDDMTGNLRSAKKFYNKFLLKLQEFEKKEYVEKPTKKNHRISSSRQRQLRNSDTDFEFKKVEKDSWEGVAWRDYDDKRLNLKVRLSYTDMSGQTTERDFDIKHYFFADDENQYYIQGHCHLRRGNRTFRLDRINSLIDLVTGEILESKEVQSHLEKAYIGSPHQEFTNLLNTYWAEQDILIYLSRLDGRFTKKEKELIFEFMYEAAGPQNSKAELFDYFVEHLGHVNPDPSQTAANKAIRAVKQKGEEATNSMIAAILALAALTKNLNPVVKAGCDMILKKLGSQPLI